MLFIMFYRFFCNLYNWSYDITLNCFLQKEKVLQQICIHNLRKDCLQRWGDCSGGWRWHHLWGLCSFATKRWGDRSLKGIVVAAPSPVLSCRVDLVLASPSQASSSQPLCFSHHEPSWSALSTSLNTQQAVSIVVALGNITHSKGEHGTQVNYCKI